MHTIRGADAPLDPLQGADQAFPVVRPCRPPLPPKKFLRTPLVSIFPVNIYGNFPMKRFNSDSDAKN